jgi:hypothetical protein
VLKRGWLYVNFVYFEVRRPAIFVIHQFHVSTGAEKTREEWGLVTR